MELNGGLELSICRCAFVMLEIVLSAVYVLHFECNASFLIHNVFNCSHGDSSVDVLVCVV